MTLVRAELLDDADKALAGRAATIPYGPGRDNPPSVVIDERKLLQAALDEPYEGQDPARLGLSKMAAAARSVANQAADGIPWAVDFVFNRLYGRPKQTISTANLNMSLKEYLQHLANPKTQTEDADVTTR